MMKVFYLTVLVIMVTMTGRSIANFDEFNFDSKIKPYLIDSSSNKLRFKITRIIHV